MGFLMAKELKYLSKAINHPQKPFYALLGGAKLDSKISVLDSLLEKVDSFFIGGGMAIHFRESTGSQNRRLYL